MGAGSVVCTCGGAGSGGSAAFLGGAGRLASVGNLQGVGGGYLVSLSETVPVPVGPSPLVPLAAAHPSLMAQPPLPTVPPRPIFHTLRHFPELAMPATLPAFGPAGPWACKTPPPPLHLDTHSSTRSQLPSRKSAQARPQGLQCSSAPPALERPQGSRNHTVPHVPSGCVPPPTELPDATAPPVPGPGPTHNGGSVNIS